MTRLEELILTLWSAKGEMPEQIAEELQMPREDVEDVIECESNFRR